MLGFFIKGTTKTALFTKRTLNLFTPVPLILLLANGAASRGINNIFTAPLSSTYKDRDFLPIHFLNNYLDVRNIPPSIKDHGDLLIYNQFLSGYDDYETEHEIDDSNSYFLESVNSFNSFMYDIDYGFKKIFVATKVSEDKIVLTSETPQNQTTSAVMFQNEPIEKSSLSEDSESNSETLAKYKWTKENFLSSSLNEKSNLSIVADLKAHIPEGDFTFPVSIDLANLIANPDQEFVLFSSQKKDKSDRVSFSFKFKQETTSNSLIIELVREGKISETQPLKSLEVHNFFIVFSENPPLPYGQLFEEATSIASDSFSYSQAKVKQIFLEKWTNKDEGITKKNQNRKRRNVSEPEGSKFSFKADDSFWKSICSDPYKVGGFIDADPTKQKTEDTEQQTKTETDTYVKQQLSLHEDFDPIKYSSRTGGKGDNFQSIYPYTTQTPCDKLDEETKKLLQEYAKPEENKETPKTKLTNEKYEYINWNLTPQPIKDLLENSEAQQQGKSKVIQGSFRAWGGSYASNYQDAQKRGIYNSLYEQANQSTHTFEVTIDKQTVETSLIDHEKLKAKDDNRVNKNLNQLPEISSQIQVSIPYSLTIYDPVSNFLKKQWVNLSVALDLRSIYNQSQYIKEFFVYDMAVNNSRIGTDYSGYAYGTSKKGKSYGLSGTISFSSGLYLDVNGDLKIQLITKTKGFVNTKNPTCDLRQRTFKFNDQNGNTKCNDQQSGWSYRKHNHIPPFIVLEINEDPTISSFYLDRRVSTSSTEEESTSSPEKDENIETLSDFKSKKLKKSEHTIVRTMDQTNNGEVYFEKLDVTDPKSPELQKAVKVKVNEGKGIELETQSAGWITSAIYGFTTYYVPRRNYGEIVIEDHSNLNEITIWIKGSTALGGDFLQSMHYGTKVTYCTSEQELSKVSAGKDCADGTKYEKIEKDKTTPEFKENKSQQIKINFSDLANTSKSNTKKFNFLTAIHRSKIETKGSTTDSNSFDTNKTKLEFLFKESGSFSKSNKNKDSFPKFSLVGVWYTLEMWWDSNNKKLCYYTKIRAISSVAEVSKKTPTLENADAHKVVGASARAGFELSKMEFKYKKSDS